VEPEVRLAVFMVTEAVAQVVTQEMAEQAQETAFPLPQDRAVLVAVEHLETPGIMAAVAAQVFTGKEVMVHPGLPAQMQALME